MTEKSLTKPFEPMLASPRGKLKFPCMVQPKYDGIRCVVRNGVALSRNLTPIANVFIRATLSTPLYEGFDGELISGPETHPDVYNNSNSVIMSEAVDPATVVYHVFDDFSDPRRPYQLRYFGLERRVPGGIIRQVPCQIAENEDDLMQLANGLFDLGYEGAMVRDMHAIYKHGRATESEGTLWKIKRMVDDEMLVTGCNEGSTNTNEATIDAKGKTKRSHAKAGKIPNGKLGALVGTSPKWPGREITVGSSNLPDMSIEDARAFFIGKLVVFKHQQAGAKDLPRFPIFKGIRDPRDLS